MSELQTSVQKDDQTVLAQTWSESVRADEEQRMAEQSARAAWFAKLAVPSAAYACFYTVFTYQNDKGLGMFAWIIVTALYAVYLLRASNIRLKKSSGFLLLLMALLGVSTLVTANEWLIFCNHYGFCLSLLYFLLTQTRDADGWNIWEMIKGMVFAVFGSIGQIWTPFAEGYSWLHTHTRMRDDEQIKKRRLVLLGIVITVPVVLCLGSLLVSADAVFGNMLGYFTFSWTLSVDAFGICITGLFGLLASYCGMHYILGSRDGREAAVQKKYPAIIAQIVTATVLALYVWFCLVQVVYLFGGLGTLPDGMTYAQYARSGFFQLLFVCMLNLVLVLAVRRFFEVAPYLNRVLLGICLCSYVMTASSAYRMLLYIQAYHLTVLRLVVLVALAAIAILLAGVIANIFNENFRILPYSVAVIGIVYLLFSFSGAERLAARYDLAHLTEENADGIFYYLSQLSFDALPEVIGYLEESDDSYAVKARQRVHDICEIYDVELGETMFDYLHPDDEACGWFVQWLGRNRQLLGDESLLSWNLSTWQAKAALTAFLEQT